MHFKRILRGEVCNFCAKRNDCCQNNQVCNTWRKLSVSILVNFNGCLLAGVHDLKCAKTIASRTEEA